MLKTTLKVTLTLEGPLLTQSSDPGNQGLDAVIARNHKGEPCFPGTLVIGKLRQAWEELRQATADNPTWFQPGIEQWLGKENKYGFAMSKRLLFSDFVLEPDPEVVDKSVDDSTGNEDIRHRITIDSERGTVRQHQLLMIENPFISGEEYAFTGTVHFFSPSEDDADAIIRHLVAGIKWFSQLGALRSVGFGRVTKADVADICKSFLTKPKKLEQPGSAEVRIGLLIEPRYPFCIAGKTVADNIFESEAIISGGAILGCIATTWNHLCGQQGSMISTINDPARVELKQNFDNLRISHAFPGSDRKRPVVAPLSLVRVDGDETLYDVALLNDPCLIANKPPDFAVEWKDDAYPSKEDPFKEYPWPYIRMHEWGWQSLKSELRVRTAIDRRSLRSAKEKLFAYEQIIPENKQWYAELDLSRIDKKQQPIVLAQLKSLLQEGVIGLGKTKTAVKITFAAAGAPIQPAFPIANAASINDNQWIITLQTDTLLGSPAALNESSGQEELEQMYQQAWKELSNSLTLKRYFARQKLFGGRHRHKIIQQQNKQKKNSLYRPWLLTEAGSVFVVQASEQDKADAQADIETWLAQGLPISTSACACYGISKDHERQWRQTPFTPQNGYGEIAVNMKGTPVILLEDNNPAVQPIQTITAVGEEA